MSSRLSTGISDRSTLHYRSGFYALGGRGIGRGGDGKIRVRGTDVWGTGTPTFSVSTDFGPVPGSSGGGHKQTLTLGTAPAIARARHTPAQFGVHFSYQIEAASGAWSVNRLVQEIP